MKEVFCRLLCIQDSRGATLHATPFFHEGFCPYVLLHARHRQGGGFPVAMNTVALDGWLPSAILSSFLEDHSRQNRFKGVTFALTVLFDARSPWGLILQ
jgi:hypothetical protein